MHGFLAGSCRLLFFWLIVIPAFTLAAQPTNVGPTPGVSPEQGNGPEAYKKLSLEQLMNLDVTSVSRSPQPFGEAPAAINVITSDQIHRSGAETLPDALRLADNLDIAQSSSSSWNISARGFDSAVSDKLLVLMDGRSLYTPLLLGVIWPMQDYLMEDIDRIEVVSGPGGTEWGQNAVNGVINITTKSSRDTQGLYLEGGGGNQLQDIGGLRYGTTLASNVFFRVYGKYMDMGPEVYADGSSAHDGWNRGQVGFRADDYRSDANQFTVEGDLLYGTLQSEPGGEGRTLGQSYQANGDILARWTHTFADDYDMSLQMYYQRSHISAAFQSNAPITPGIAIPAGNLGDDMDTYNLDFQDRFLLGDWNHFVWGLGYQFTHDVVTDAPLVGFEPNILDQNLYSGFVEDRIKILDNVSAYLGTKVEHNDYTGWEYEPSIRLQFNVTDKQMFWASVSRAVRAPARYDRDLFEPSPGYGSFLGTSNSFFESETVVAYELGYRAQFSDKVAASVSTFYNDYEHLRSLGLTDGTQLPLIFENELHGRTYGIEPSLDYQAFEWWRLHAGYDLIKEEIHPEPGGTDLFNGLNETADPQQQVYLRSSLDLPFHATLDANLRWIDTVHNNSGPTPGEVPSYAELDAAINWQATKHLEFALVGENLLHSQHAEAGYPGPTQEQIARSVFVKAMFRW